MNAGRLYTFAAVLSFAAAALNVVALVSPGTASAAVLVAGAILCAAIGWGLLGRRRWVAYLGFVSFLVAGIVAMGGAVGAMGIGESILWLTTIVAWIAAATLFIVLWRARPRAIDA